jgi:head-tail adaptor
MYVTVPVAVQRRTFGAADADGLADEWPRANTLWAPTMDETTRVAPSNTIHRFFT